MLGYALALGGAEVTGWLVTLKFKVLVLIRARSGLAAQLGGVGTEETRPTPSLVSNVDTLRLVRGRIV
jgi:hypothetical protein